MHHAIAPLPPSFLTTTATSGGPLLSANAGASFYAAPFAARFPCLLSNMELRPAGKSSVLLCQYNTTQPPSTTALASLHVALCRIAASALEVNWGTKCAQGRDAQEDQPLLVDETWTGVVFLGTYIGLSLSGIGLRGSFPSDLCDVKDLKFLDLSLNQLNGKRQQCWLLACPAVVSFRPLGFWFWSRLHRVSALYVYSIAKH